MFNSIISSGLTIVNFSICIVVAIILGLVVAFFHMKTTRSNHNFINTLVILPALVTIVILLVNGNLGTSVAVVGAFSLVRFRSIPGNSKEILDVFFAMSIGLALGTGYIAFAIIYTLFIGILSFVLYKLKFGVNKSKSRIMKIAIPEDLDYENVFEELFNKYTDKVELFQSKTINMGSMFELTYLVNLKDDISEKEFMDDIRIKNGNLKVILTHELENKEVLWWLKKRKEI